MNCPNINIEQIRNEFNSVIIAFGGTPMTIEEFKSKDIRNMRSGVDDSAMQIAYYVWDKTNGEGLAALPEYALSNTSDEHSRIREIVNQMLGINNEVKYEFKAIEILLSDRAKQVFDKGNKNGWSLDKILTELAVPKEQKVLLLDLGITDREQLVIELQSRYVYNVEVKTTIDEYGNQWREIDLSSNKVLKESLNIVFKKSSEVIDESPLADKPLYSSAMDIYYRNLEVFEKQRQSVIRNNNITDDYISQKEFSKLIKKYNTAASRIAIEILETADADGYNEKKYRVLVTIKQSAKAEAKAAAEAKFARLLADNPAYAEKVNAEANAPVSEAEINEIITTDSDVVEVSIKKPSHTDSKPYGGTQLNLLDELFKSQGNVKRKAKKRSLKVLTKIASKMSARFGVSFEIVSQEEAYGIYIQGLSPEKIESFDAFKATMGFYDPETKTAYLINGEFDGDTAIHEIFGHPFLYMLKSNPELIHIYNALALEAVSNFREANEVLGDYESFVEETQLDEIILRALEKPLVELMDRPKLYTAVSNFWKEFTQFIKKLFRIKSGINHMRSDTTLNELAEWILFGRGEIKLVGGEDAKSIQNEVDKVLKTFSNKNYDNLMTSVITLSQAMEYSTAVNEELIGNWVIENGFYSSNYIKNSILADLNYVGLEREAVFNANGAKIGIFSYKIEDGKFILSKVDVFKSQNKGNVLLSVLRHANKFGYGKIYVNKESLGSLVEELVASNTIPMEGVSITSINDIGHFVINKAIADRFAYEPIVMKKSHVKASELSIKEVDIFLKGTVNGLKAQLRSLERQADVRQESIDRVKRLIDTIDISDATTAALNFVDYADIEADRVLNRTTELTALMNDDKKLDNGAIHDIKRNFLTLYKNSMESIRKMNNDRSGLLSSLSERKRKDVSDKIANVAAKLNDISTQIDVLMKYAYANQLVEEAERVGSTTIDNIFETDVYKEETDISGFSSFLFGMAYSNKEQLRILHKIVSDVNSSVARRIENDGVLANLQRKFEAVKAVDKLATYDRFMEFDEKGRATGYLISDLLYGVFNKNYTDFKKKLMKKYNLVSDYDYPTDPKERMKYVKEKDAFLNEHVERRFTKEYYDLKNSLSEETQLALDSANNSIRTFISKFLDADGFIDTSMMNAYDLEKYFEVKKAKQNLSSFYYTDGTAKPEGGSDYAIATELSAFNKKMQDNVKYRPKYELFNKKYSEIKATKSKEEALKWYRLNTKTTYTQEFWDELSKIERAGQSEAWEKVYKARAAILRMYRGIDSMEVNAARLNDSHREARERVEKYDIWLAANREYTKSDGPKFNDIAEVVPTDEFLMEEEKAKRMPGTSALKEFYDRTYYTGPKGKKMLHSQWTKLMPVNENYIVVEPNSMWSEVDVESNFYNKNFSEDRAEEGLQPKRSLYDNSSKFNKLMSKKHNAEFRDALKNAYATANKNYSYLNNPSSLRLAQIPGGFLHKATHGDTLLKGVGRALSDKFNYRPYEAGFGDYETRGSYRADGSPLNFIETKFRTMLDTPNMISRDLLGSFTMYYKGAVNYKLMTERVDDIEMILAGVENTRAEGFDKRGKYEQVQAGSTKMYKRAKEFVDSNVYGADRASMYMIPIGKHHSISIAKPVKDFINYVRKINLAFNLRAIYANMVGAEIHMKIEASCGTFITKKSYRFATMELAKNMPSVMESTYNRVDNKILGMMRMFELARTNENDMRGLHGSQMVNTLVNNFWYGPYSAGDFVVKSRMMIAVMSNYKYYNGEFLNREAFMTKYFPSNRYDGDTVFDAISENLYGAFVLNENGMLKVAEQYKDAITADTVNNMSTVLNNLGRKLDGTLTGSEKSKLHVDAFGAALMLHRGWLMNAIQERFHPKIFSYEKQMMISGEYNKENWSAALSIMFKFLGNKISDIRTYGSSAANLKLGTMKNNLSGSQLYNSRRILGEVKWLVILSVLTTILGQMVPLERDKSKDEDSWQMWLYIMTLRNAMELWALYSPMDVYGIVGNPTAAEGTLNNISDIFESFFAGESLDIIESGRYKYKTKLERGITKMIPGYKQIYEGILKPDLGASEEFMLENLPSQISALKFFTNPYSKDEAAKKLRRREIMKIKEEREDAFKKAKKEREKSGKSSNQSFY